MAARSSTTKRASVRAADRQTGGKEGSEDGFIAARSEPTDRVDAVAHSKRESRRRGRPPAYGQTVVVTVRLPTGLVDQIDTVIESTGFKYRDRSELIRQVLADAVGGWSVSKAQDAAPSLEAIRKVEKNKPIDKALGEILGVYLREKQKASL